MTWMKRASGISALIDVMQRRLSGPHTAHRFRPCERATSPIRIRKKSPRLWHWLRIRSRMESLSTPETRYIMLRSQVASIRSRLWREARVPSAVTVGTVESCTTSCAIHCEEGISGPGGAYDKDRSKTANLGIVLDRGAIQREQP